jgi:hypothetical protein
VWLHIVLLICRCVAPFAFGYVYRAQHARGRKILTVLSPAHYAALGTLLYYTVLSPAHYAALVQHTRRAKDTRTAGLAAARLEHDSELGTGHPRTRGRNRSMEGHRADPAQVRKVRTMF